MQHPEKVEAIVDRLRRWGHRLVNESQNSNGIWRSVSMFLAGMVLALAGSVWAGVRSTDRLETRLDSQTTTLAELQAEVKESREQFARLRERVTAIEARVR
jgi:hypothetical protein